MGGRVQIAFVLLAVLATMATGCGSSSSDSSSTSEAPPSTKFSAAKANSKYVSFGEKADAAEREEASAVLAKNLEAREDHDWTTQCATLTAQLNKTFGERGTFYKVGKTCPKALEYEAKGAPKSVLANTMIEPIAVLRVKGNKGYALYHGPKGKDYAMLMGREKNGEWKVAEVKTIELSS